MGNCCGRPEPASPQPEATSIFPDAASPEDDAAFDAELFRAKRGEDFTFAGIVTPVKVVDVYDGDTIRFIFRYRGELVQYRIRMLGYDSPEMKPPRGRPNREAEVAAAVAARDALKQLVLDKVLVAELGGFEKFGRILATLYLTEDPKKRRDAICVNQWMLQKGHGAPYAGGTKTPFAAQAQ